MKILVATEKPFAAVAVNGIREVIEAAGAELVLLEKYTEKAQLLAAVADVDGIIIREAIAAAGVKPVESVEELYRNCQYVSLHIPATAETKNSINYSLTSIMPKGAMLVNTARKEVINEADLVRIMEERADFRYTSDIAPANLDELKEKFGNRVFATPKKMGAQTAEANINAGIAAAHQTIGFLRDGIEKFRVNK